MHMQVCVCTQRHTNSVYKNNAGRKENVSVFPVLSIRFVKKTFKINYNRKKRQTLSVP